MLFRSKIIKKKLTVVNEILDVVRVRREMGRSTVACRHHHVTWKRHQRVVPAVPRSKPKSGPEPGLRALKKRSPSRRLSRPSPTASLRLGYPGPARLSLRLQAGP